ncbi:NOP12_1 [Sanghuangporus weigelae]
MSEKRGDPNANVDGNNESEADSEASNARQRSSWVTRVRIVRDRETQVGKGFAYVHFIDRDCVDEVLALEAEIRKTDFTSSAMQDTTIFRAKTTSTLGKSNSLRLTQDSFSSYLKVITEG